MAELIETAKCGADFEQPRPFKNFIFRRLGPDGTTQWIRTSGIPYYDADGQFRGYCGVASNITDEQEVLEAQHADKQRFQDIAESSFDRFWETDKNHRFTYFSSADNLEADIPPSSLLGNTRWESSSTNVDEDENWREHFRTLDAHLPFRDFQYSRIDRTGNIRHFSVNGVPVFDELGRFEGYRGTATDITARIEANRALSDATANLSAAVESLSEAFAFWDNEDRLVICNQQFRMINEAVIETTVPGTRYEDHLRATLDKGLVPTASGREQQYFDERMLAHRSPGPPYELQHCGRWLQVSEKRANGRGIVAVAVDITERKRAEIALREAHDQLDRLVEDRTAALRDNQALLETVIDAAPLVINAKDRNSRYTLINRYNAELLGVRPAQALGKSLDEFVGTKRAARTAALDAQVIETGNAIRYAEIASGEGVNSQIWQTTKAPLMRDDGAISGVVTIELDVTEQRNREAQLRQAQKMEVVGQLTGGIAHDFNNILTIVMGHLELIGDTLGEHEVTTELLAPALAATERGAQLIQGLLSFARRQTLEPTGFDMNTLATRTLGMLRRTLGETIEIEFMQGQALARTVADPSQLENALINLAVNARDAMPNGGTLTIETANAILDDDYAASHQEVEPGNYVMLAVSDTGTGIAPDQLERIFEPFYTTKKAGEGSGLGLSMVYGFAKQSQGHVSVYSEVGIGTTVKLFLPRERRATTDSTIEETLAKPKTGGETILLLEDDPDLRKLAVRTLAGLGYQVWEAPDALAAQAVLDSRGAPDLLLSDVVLPKGINGPHFARTLRARYPSTKVLFMSGYTQQAMLQHTDVEEGIALLSKPFRRNDLAARVRSVLDDG